MPRKRRLIEPVRIGVAISRPSWVSVRPSSSLIRMPMMEKMVQTAKQRVNAKVDKPSARYWSLGVGVVVMAALEQGKWLQVNHIKNAGFASGALEVPPAGCSGGRRSGAIARTGIASGFLWRSEEHTSELQSRPHLVCRLLLEKKK